MRDRTARDWEELGRREPFFAVVTDERFLLAAMGEVERRELFQQGENDAEHLFELAAAYLGRPFHPARALDYGCGVGRLTVALARRARRVVGLDVARSMLEHAAASCREAGLGNVELREADEGLAHLAPGSFDLVASLLVFQHIPVRRGEAILESLLTLLAPGGVAALHFTFERPGGPLRRAARRLRARLPLLHRLAQLLQGRDPHLPYLQMNAYRRERVLALFERHGCRQPLSDPTDHGGVRGAIVVGSKRPA